jgi:hypothetical protein
MPDRAAEFFDELNGRGHDRRLRKIDGTLRFDLAQDGRPAHWIVEVRRGNVKAFRTSDPPPADCILHTTQAWFERFVTGEDDILAALLRADAVAEGNLQLMFVFRRLTANPAQAHDPRDLYQLRGKNR